MGVPAASPIGPFPFRIVMFESHQMRYFENNSSARKEKRLERAGCEDQKLSVINCICNGEFMIFNSSPYSGTFEFQRYSTYFPTGLGLYCVFGSQFTELPINMILQS